MAPPGDVAEQAGGQAEPLLGNALACEERLHPGRQFISESTAQRGLAAGPAAEGAAARDQRVAALVLGRELLMQQPLAQAPGREQHLPGRQPQQQPIEHQCRRRQRRQAGPVDAGDAGQRIRAETSHHGTEALGLGPKHGVMVHHAQRIAGLGHVDTGQRPPGAADGMEIAAPAGQPGRLGQRRVYGLGRASGHSQRPQRQGDALAAALSVEVHQFQTAAAKITHHAGRAGKGGPDPGRRGLGFLAARQHPDLEAGSLGHLGHEGLAVGGLAYRRGGHHDGRLDGHAATERGEAANGNVGLGRGLGRQLAAGGQIAPQAAEHALVEDRQRRPGGSFEDHQAHRVGADVDDRRPLPVRRHVGLGRQCHVRGYREPGAGSAALHSVPCRGPTGWGWS